MLQERGASGPALRQRALGPGAVPAESAYSLGSAAPPPTPRADWGGQVGAHGTGAAIPPVDETVVALTLVTPGQVRHQPRRVRCRHRFIKLPHLNLPYSWWPARQRVVGPAALWEAAGAGVCPARVPCQGVQRVQAGHVAWHAAGACTWPARPASGGKDACNLAAYSPSQARFSKTEARVCRWRARAGHAAAERGRRPGARILQGWRVFADGARAQGTLRLSADADPKPHSESEARVGRRRARAGHAAAERGRRPGAAF
jgi:hypothetical protein